MSNEIVSVCKGKYECVDPIVRVDSIPKIVTNLNVTLEVCMFPGGDITATPIPTGLLFEPGLTNVLFTDGAYLLKGIECVDGAPAPTDGTAVVVSVCQMDPHGGAMDYISQGIRDLCKKLLDLTAGSDNTELVAAVTALCTKIAAGNELTTSMIAELQALCAKIEADAAVQGDILAELTAVVSAIQDLCTKLESLIKIEEDSNACLKVIKANTAAITGIETSLGQIGCTEDAEGNITGSVLVCKHTDTTTDPATDIIKVWWFGLDGTVLENYQGPYIACTNLQALANILEDMLDKLKSVKRPFTIECVQKFTRCVGYDNGVTPGSSVNDGGLRDNFVQFGWTFKVKGWLVNGTEVGIDEPLGPFTGWTPQLEGWAAFFNANMPAGSKCQADFGFLPAPTWRYSKITCNDPTTNFGPLRIERDDGVCFTIYPLFDEIKIELAYRYNTLDCDGNKETIWCDASGNPVEAPVDPECWYSCAVVPGPMIAGPAGPDCTAPTAQKVCDKVGEVLTEFYQVAYYCDGVRRTEGYTVESWLAGSAVEYVPVGQVVDCNTGEPVLDPATLDDFKVVKEPTGALVGADYTKVLCYINGRPLPNVPWAWIDNPTGQTADQVTVAAGDDLESFIAAVEDLGYTEFSVGEQHYICPVPANFSGPGSHFFTADGDTVSKPDAVAIPAGAPAKVIETAAAFCALRTIGCNDDRRDNLLQELLDKSCLQYDATANPNACGSPVPEDGLDKEALTLTLAGDVGAQYPQGATIAMKDANGNICGSATSTGTTELVAGKTVVTIQECEMAAGKEPAVIKTAAPVLQATATAVKTLVKKQVAVRAVKIAIEK